MASKGYRSATDFRRALEERLKNRSRESGMDLQRMRRHVAFDRLLCRLFFEENAPWVLKGGYAMELRIGSARTTRDIDLTMRHAILAEDNKEQQNLSLLKMLQNAADRDLSDYFVYRIGLPKMDLEAAPYGGARFPVSAILDGRSFTSFHLDIGIGDVVAEPFDVLSDGNWLEFAAISAGEFLAISKEAQFAEKLHAYTLPRRERVNSRVRDLVDMVLLINEGELDSNYLRDTISKTFKRRATHPIPKAIPDPPEFWTSVYQDMADECGLSVDIEDGLEIVSQYFNPLGL